MSVRDLTVLWRGSLASCNYGCAYCPFAKTEDDKAALVADRAALTRFEAWVAARPAQVSILITPWGEGLIRKYYREAMLRLSHRPNVPTIAIQTNLSCSVAWTAQANRNSLALWTTYHPDETPRETFVAKIATLEEIGIRYSVGVVGLKEHLDAIEALRRELPAAATLWVNAYKRVPNYYSATELDRLTAIDPLFALNLQTYATKQLACHAGETAISVLADGTARRCHFLSAPIGNIFDADFDQALQPRLCPAEQCRCHIGYSHLKSLDLSSLFGNGVIERRPDHPVTQADAQAAIARYATERAVQLSNTGR